MSHPFTRSLMSFAAFALTAMLVLVTLPADAGAGVAIISLI